jgi:hypothetical protein
VRSVADAASARPNICLRFKKLLHATTSCKTFLMSLMATRFTQTLNPKY